MATECKCGATRVTLEDPNDGKVLSPRCEAIDLTPATEEPGLPGDLVIGASYDSDGNRVALYRHGDPACPEGHPNAGGTWYLSDAASRRRGRG